MTTKDLKVKKSCMSASEYLSLHNDIIKNCVNETTGDIIWSVKDIILQNTFLLFYFDVDQEMDANEAYALSSQVYPCATQYGINCLQWESLVETVNKELKALEKKNYSNKTNHLFANLNAVFAELTRLLNELDSDQLLMSISKSLLLNDNNQLVKMMGKIKEKETKKEVPNKDIDPKNMN
ncbi:MAG: hypothetical protein ACLRVU_03355 [Beduini sp.]|uniref:hypothetical protein n=1 Tax=Beduini sp. TaxID=1922300 RepID=UPI0039A1FB88